MNNSNQPFDQSRRRVARTDRTNQPIRSILPDIFSFPSYGSIRINTCSSRVSSFPSRRSWSNIRRIFPFVFCFPSSRIEGEVKFHSSCSARVWDTSCQWFLSVLDRLNLCARIFLFLFDSSCLSVQSNYGSSRINKCRYA